MDALLGLYAAPWDAVFHLPAWQANLVISVLVLAKISFAGWSLAKAGRSPLWALLALIPWIELVGLWAFAYARWPGMERRTEES